MKRAISFLLSISFFLFFGIKCLYGQDVPKQYTIYLIDGSMLRATVLEETETHTRIKIISGDELLLDNHLIKSKEAENSNVVLSDGNMVQDSGRYNLISFGLMPGVGAASFDGFVMGASILHYVHGLQFNQYASLGAGIGFDVYDKGFLPVYADFRGYLFNDKFSTFYSLQAGYSFAFWDLTPDDGETYSGGLMVYPAIGVRLARPQKNSNVLFELGYKMQWSNREFEWNERVDDTIYRRISLRVGFLF